MVIGATEILETIICGLLLGGLYGVIVMGLNIIFGVLGVVNVAHGEFLMLGAYTAFWMFILTAGLFNPLLSLIAALPLGFILGMVLYRFAVVRVVGAPELTTLLLFFGFSTFVANTVLYVWGSEYRGIPYSLPRLYLGEITIPMSYVVGFLSAVTITIALHVLFVKTYIGKAIRAVAQDREAAVLMGIDVDRIMMVAFGIGIALAFGSGCILVIVSPTIHAGMGGYWTLLSFCIAVLGGLGSEKGSLVAGFIIGIIETVVIRWVIPAILAPAIAFVILVLTLLIKPTGLFGK